VLLNACENRQCNQSSTLLIPTFDSLKLDKKIDSVLNVFINVTDGRDSVLVLYVQQLNTKSNIYTLMAGENLQKQFQYWTPMFYIKKRDRICFIYCGMESLFNINTNLKRIQYSTREDTIFAWTIVSTIDTFYVDKEWGAPFSKIPHIDPRIDSILRKNLRDFKPGQK
jgi:hypothetical protein